MRSREKQAGVWGAKPPIRKHRAGVWLCVPRRYVRLSVKGAKEASQVNQDRMGAAVSGYGDDVCAECEEELLLGLGADDCVMCRCTTACLCVPWPQCPKSVYAFHSAGPFLPALVLVILRPRLSNYGADILPDPLVPSRARCIVLASYAQNWRCACHYLRAATLRQLITSSTVAILNSWRS